MTKIIDLTAVKGDLDKALTNALRQVQAGGAAQFPHKHNTVYLSYLSLLRSNLLLVASCNDDQGDTEHDGLTVSERLSHMADEISDLMTAVRLHTGD